MVAMTIPIPDGEHVPTADQRVVMYGMSWEAYEALLELRGDRSRPRMAYLNGALELMTTTEHHERITRVIRALTDSYMLEIGMDFSAYGEWTMKKRGPDEEAAGIEADDCYRLGLDQTEGRWPDLAIEVVWTSGGIDKLEAYRRIGVHEVWFWKAGQIAIYVLTGGKYERRDHSEVIPGIDLALVARFVDEPVLSKAIREYREALRAARTT